MSSDINSKLEVLCEIVKRIEVDVQEVKQKVTTQNGNVARLNEWRGIHEIQAEARTRHISATETRLSELNQTLEPVISALKHPRIVLLAVAAFSLIVVKDTLVSAFSLLGI